MNDAVWATMATAGALIAIGALGVLARRNMLIVLMSLEIMLNGVNILFVAGSRLHADPTGHVVAFFSLTVAAAEVAIGLALVVTIFHRLTHTDSDDLNVLHG